MGYYLRFYDRSGRLPPVLSDGNIDIKIDSYIVGDINDPNWKLYPKKEFLQARGKYPINQVFTDYEGIDNTYVYYTPLNDGPTRAYSQLLRKYFENLYDTQQKYIKEEEIKKLKQDIEKVSQIKFLIADQTKKLELYKKELNKLSSIRERAVRANSRSSPIKKNRDYHIKEHDKSYPDYIRTVNSIEVLKNNMSSLKKELKSYK